MALVRVVVLDPSGKKKIYLLDEDDLANIPNLEGGDADDLYLVDQVADGGDASGN